MSLQKQKNDNEIIFQENITKVNGQSAIKSYKRGEFLGKGGFARCYLASNIETGKISAAKIVDKASLAKNRAKQKLVSEIRIHKTLHHSNIVQFQNCFEDSNSVYIFLELCPNKTLSQYLKTKKRVSVAQTKSFIHQLLLAVKYIHSNKVIHRDLKLGNIFLGKNYELKVGDFGLATKLEFTQERKRTICGTPNYIAPEIIEGTVGYSYEVDIWSCGVICYALLFGKPPFQTNQVKTTYGKIRACQYQFPDNSIPEEAKDFIKRILQLNPQKRLTVSEMLDHSFLYCSKLLKTPKLDIKSQNKINLQTSKRSLSSYKPQLNQSKQILSQRVSISKGNKTVSILKHVDYSTKYGVGYVLTNGNYGVYFNDSSKIYLNSFSNELTFIPTGCQDKQNYVTIKSSDISSNYKDLTKKFALLQHFKCYLNTQLKGKKMLLQPQRSQLIFVKQWIKTKQATLFRLSNKLIQVDFLDQTQLLLSTEQKMVIFTNKRGQQICMPISDAPASQNPQLIRRIQYTKQVLNSIKKKNEEQPRSNEEL